MLVTELPRLYEEVSHRAEIAICQVNGRCQWDSEHDKWYVVLPYSTKCVSYAASQHEDVLAELQSGIILNVMRNGQRIRTAWEAEIEYYRQHQP